MDGVNNDLERIYSEIPGRYEMANHVLTLGLDRPWRRRAALIAARRGGDRWIDLCCGTGEMAVQLKRLADRDCLLFGADFSMPMLSRARRKRETGEIHFLLSEIDALPFPDGSFDLVTVAFAARNIDRGGDTLLHSFREILRVLKPGGFFVNLETSQPRNPLARMLFRSYVRLMVRTVGGVIGGYREGYSYLSNSILRFHSREHLSGILRGAGFSEVESVPLLFGAAAVHTAVR
jgi:demethylmenaquinone methyltransferase/2-methoxy-6-polyprenyl-1,4-benzoquinol methylase